jgi:alpha-beta hydrolase superfamily lysophospholipase
MKQENFTFFAPDGVEIFVYKWLPEGKVKAVVNIAHGMAETAARYERFAAKLTGNGYAVYAEDHRGHGRTIKNAAYAGETQPDGLNLMLNDLHQLSGIIKKEIPDVPLFLMGHSMGSFLTQGYISRWGVELKGAILSGTAGPNNILAAIGKGVASLEILRIGRTGKSKLLNNLSFVSFNKQFKPQRTDFDWLSRDEAEVDKYIADPFCGGIFPAGFFYDMFKFLMQIQSRKALVCIPQDLPLYIFSGSCDPVGADTKSVRQLIELYELLGIKDLSFKFYQDGRHEMLNEINREEVMADIVQWFNAHI